MGLEKCGVGELEVMKGAETESRKYIFLDE